jgi:hypothetical protein
MRVEQSFMMPPFPTRDYLHIYSLLFFVTVTFLITFNHLPYLKYLLKYVIL